MTVASKTSGLNSNETIRSAIQKIALHGLVNPYTGVVRDSAKITGYVCKIHTDGELAGTIDVQEFINLSLESSGDVKQGYHEGVYLSAIQNNAEGLLIVPKLYSEVVVVIDPETKTEYVTMFSHVDLIQLDSFEQVTIGVAQREEYRADDEEGPDIDELKKTGAFTKSVYLKDSVVTEVQGEKDANRMVQMISDEKFHVVAGDDKSSELIDLQKIRLKHGDAEAILGEDDSTVKYGSSSVVVEDGTVYLGDRSGTDDAVLGSELAAILMDMLDYVSQVKTTTQLGPQPPLNMAQFIALKAKINAFKSSHSGFLTKKVQVQK